MSTVTAEHVDAEYTKRVQELLRRHKAKSLWDVPAEERHELQRWHADRLAELHGRDPVSRDKTTTRRKAEREEARERQKEDPEMASKKEAHDEEVAARKAERVERNKTIMKLRKDGLSYAAIGEQVGMTGVGVRNVIIKNGK